MASWLEIAGGAIGLTILVGVLWSTRVNPRDAPPGFRRATKDDLAPLPWFLFSDRERATPRFVGEIRGRRAVTWSETEFEENEAWWDDEPDMTDYRYAAVETEHSYPRFAADVRGKGNDGTRLAPRWTIVPLVRGPARPGASAFAAWLEQQPVHGSVRFRVDGRWASLQAVDLTGDRDLLARLEEIVERLEALAADVRR